jgi:hypothetical protein
MFQRAVLLAKVGAEFLDPPYPSGRGRGRIAVLAGFHQYNWDYGGQWAAAVGNDGDLICQVGESHDLRETRAGLRQRQLETAVRDRSGGFCHTVMMTSAYDIFRRAAQPWWVTRPMRRPCTTVVSWMAANASLSAASPVRPVAAVNPYTVN